MKLITSVEMLAKANAEPPSRPNFIIRSEKSFSITGCIMFSQTTFCAC